MKILNFTINSFVLTKTSLLYEDDPYKIIDNPNFHLYAVLSSPICTFIGIKNINNDLSVARIKCGSKILEVNLYHDDLGDFDSIKFNFSFNSTKTIMKIVQIGVKNNIEERTEQNFDANQLYQLYSPSVDFTIEYIGQSFGKNGERNAKKRAENHKTLQKILSINNDSFEQKYIQLLLLNSEYFEAKDGIIDEDGVLIGKECIISIDDTPKENDGEFLNLLEAFLINYFKPKYNKEFVSGNIPCEKHQSYSVIYDLKYNYFSFNAYYNLGLEYSQDINLLTNHAIIQMKNGVLSNRICISIDEGNIINPEEYYYSFFDYKN